MDSIFFVEGFPSPFPQMLHVGKLFHTSRIRGRGFSWLAAIGVTIAIVLGFITLLSTVEPRGAGSLSVWPWIWPNWYVSGALSWNLRSPVMPDPWMRGALGLGVAFVLGLVWLQGRFLWWPLSPFGFFIGSSYIMNHVMWVSIFLGWLAASVTLRYGGLRLFRQLRPIALGLVLGYYIMKLPVTILCAILHIQGTGGSFAY